MGKENVMILNTVTETHRQIFGNQYETEKMAKHLAKHGIMPAARVKSVKDGKTVFRPLYDINVVEFAKKHINKPIRPLSENKVSIEKKLKKLLLELGEDPEQY